jgi:integrase
VLEDGYADGGKVFASEHSTPLHPDNVTKRFMRVLDRAGLPRTTLLHDLRLGTATLMLEAGATVPTVAEYLGLATPAVTVTIYAHAVPGSKKRADERLGRSIGAPGRPW